MYYLRSELPEIMRLLCLFNLFLIKLNKFLDLIFIFQKKNNLQNLDICKVGIKFLVKIDVAKENKVLEITWMLAKVLRCLFARQPGI